MHFLYWTEYNTFDMSNRFFIMTSYLSFTTMSDICSLYLFRSKMPWSCQVALQLSSHLSTWESCLQEGYPTSALLLDTGRVNKWNAYHTPTSLPVLSVLFYYLLFLLFWFRFTFLRSGCSEHSRLVAWPLLATFASVSSFLRFRDNVNFSPLSTVLWTSLISRWL